MPGSFEAVAADGVAFLKKIGCTNVWLVRVGRRPHDDGKIHDVVEYRATIRNPAEAPPILTELCKSPDVLHGLYTPNWSARQQQRGESALEVHFLVRDVTVPGKQLSGGDSAPDGDD